jgi:hypothetical protein
VAQKTFDSPMSLTLRQKLDRFPPVVCRLLARRQLSATSSLALTDEAIVVASNRALTVADVKGLSWAKSWGGVPVEKVIAFTNACGVDFDDHKALKRNWHRVQIGTGSHLLRSPLWRDYFRHLVKHAGAAAHAGKEVASG